MNASHHFSKAKMVWQIAQQDAPINLSDFLKLIG